MGDAGHQPNVTELALEKNTLRDQKILHLEGYGALKRTLQRQKQT